MILDNLVYLCINNYSIYLILVFDFTSIIKLISILQRAAIMVIMNVKVNLIDFTIIPNGIYIL